MSAGSARALWPSRDYRLRAGAKLGSYRILSPLGAGGMAEVYLAEHVFMSRTAAIKIMQVERESRDDLMDRFKAEIELLAQIDHDNVVKVYEASITDEGMVWMAMEHLCGRTMVDVIYDERPAVPDALDLLAQAADGLDAAHRVGAVHRDIKPENLFVTDDDIVKVLDFGIAKLVDRGVPRRHAVKTTVRDKQMGTIAYMSPEQLVGDRRLDRRTDVWSLGVVAYELLAGRYPFAQTDGELPPIDLLGFFILRPDQQPPPPGRFNKEVPAAVSEVVLRCLAKEPDGRFATMAELAKALRRERDRDKASATPAPSPAVASATSKALTSKQTIKMTSTDQARASAAPFASHTAPRAPSPHKDQPPRKATVKMTPVAESTGGKAALARPAASASPSTGGAAPARAPAAWPKAALAIGGTAIAVTGLGWLALSGATTRDTGASTGSTRAAESSSQSAAAPVELTSSDSSSALGPRQAPVIASTPSSTSTAVSTAASSGAPASPPTPPPATPPTTPNRPNPRTPAPPPPPKPKHDSRLF